MTNFSVPNFNMLEIKICEWGDYHQRLILAPIDSAYNELQKPINDYLLSLFWMNFTQVLINHFYFVINKNYSQLNALINFNYSCLCSFINFIHIWSWHLMGVWSQLFSDCFDVLLLDLNWIQFNLSNLQNRDLQK